MSTRRNNSKKLSDFEIDYILNNYKNKSLRKMTIILNRDARTISKFLVEKSLINHKNQKEIFWTKEEEKFILDNYKLLTIEEISKKLNRTIHSIKSRMLNKLNISILQLQMEREDFSEENKNFILNNYQTLSIRQISKLIKKDARKIIRFLSILNLRRSKTKQQIHLEYLEKLKWDEKDNLFLLENYSKLTCAEISNIINKPQSEIYWKVRKINLKKPVFWTEERIDFLKFNHKIMSTEEMALILNKNLRNIESKLKKLNLDFKRFNYQIWTDYQTKFLIENFDIITNQAISKILNKNTKEINNKLRELSLEKNIRIKFGQKNKINI